MIPMKTVKAYAGFSAGEVFPPCLRIAGLERALNAERMDGEDELPLLRLIRDFSLPAAING